MRPATYLYGLLVAAALQSLTFPVAASAASTPGPHWNITSAPAPGYFPPASAGDLYLVTATNVGGGATSAPVTIEDTLPPGMAETNVSGTGGNHPLGDAFTRGSMACETVSVAERRYKCTYGGPVAPGDLLRIAVEVSAPGPFNVPEPVNTASVSGGGAGVPAATVSVSTKITGEPTPFGIARSSFFTAVSTDQAGAHPNLTTSFALNRTREKSPSLPELSLEPVDPPRDIELDLPVGLVGNPLAVPRCNALAVTEGRCPEEDAVGVATVEAATHEVELVYNIVPYPGEPAAFAFEVGGGLATVRLDTSLIRNSRGEYAIHVSVPEANESEAVADSTVTLWGVPADYNGPGPDHTSEKQIVEGQSVPVTFGGPGSQAALAKPFLRNPSACAGELTSALSLESWPEPTSGGGKLVSYTAMAEAPVPASSSSFTGCPLLSPLFAPSLQVSPDGSSEIAPHTFQAGGPAGYEVQINAPQNQNPAGNGAPDLRNASVTLPAGTVTSPSAANGLGVCTDTQLGATSTSPAACPQASQIGEVEIETPLLLKPLEGQVFLGQPECSPCSGADAQEGKMLRLFLQAEGSGVRLKLAGRTHVNQQTGQLTTVFEDNPQQPFEKLTLRLDGGERAPLANPAACGTATATSQLVPWSSTPEEPLTAEPSSSFQVGGCAPPRFAVSLSSGMTQSSRADDYSAYTVRISRTDQDQDLGGITVRTPPGLLGAVSHVPLCPEPAASQGACAADSQIGTVTVAAGPGSEPFWITAGRAYLTGPYKGAPYGLSIVVPAVAGPFNLGEEHVRAAIHIDPHTTALTIVSDPLPTIKDGIPFQLKTIDVNVDRPEFMFNATNCDAMSIGATISSNEGILAERSSPYQPTNCAKLAFHPSFSASTQANGSFNGNGASLNVRIVAPGQGPQSSTSVYPEANIEKVGVQLPLAMPSRLTTLQKACTERQFALDPAGCPPESNVGVAIAHTPVLPLPLQGPAYLVSHGGAQFPDLDIVLQGDGLVVDLVGNTQIRKGATYSKFETVPDAPISSFELNLPEGRYSALAAYVSSGSLCAPTKATTLRKRVARRVHGHLIHVLRSVRTLRAAPLLMPTTITGQNGAVLSQNTKIAVTGCSKAKRPRKLKKGKKTRGGRRSKQT